MKTMLRATIVPGLVCAAVAAAACGNSATTAGSGGTGGATHSATSSHTTSATTTTTATTSGTGGAGTGGAGAGTSLMCASSGKNAYETYMLAGFVAVNKAIINNTLQEVTTNGSANVGDSFTKVGTGNPPSTTDDLTTFEGKLAAFLVWTYGGPNSIMYTDGKTYDGIQDMVAAHTGLNITQAQYTYFLTNVVVPALTSSGVTQADVTSCFAPTLMDPNFVATIVGH